MRSAGDAARRDFLVQVAKCYYEQDLSQVEIARKFGISRSLVSYHLKACRSEGIVDIRILDTRSRASALRGQLVERFGLADAVVVPAGAEGGEPREKVGTAAAVLLERFLREDVCIGISWGTTLHACVSHVRPHPVRGLEVVQLHGGMGAGDPSIDGFGLAQMLAAALFGGYRIVQAPVLVRNRALRDMLVKEPNIRDVLSRGKEADVALLGIGSDLPAISALVRAGALGEAESRRLLEQGAVGTVCGIHLRADGVPLSSSINQRLVGLAPRDIRAIPVRIGLAAGVEKAPAVGAALRGSYVSILVADEELSEAVMAAAAGPGD
jgi:deoxyribonucleoside regulator